MRSPKAKVLKEMPEKEMGKVVISRKTVQRVSPAYPLSSHMCLCRVRLATPDPRNQALSSGVS